MLVVEEIIGVESFKVIFRFIGFGDYLLGFFFVCVIKWFGFFFR